MLYVNSNVKQMNYIVVPGELQAVFVVLLIFVIILFVLFRIGGKVVYFIFVCLLYRRKSILIVPFISFHGITGDQAFNAN